MFLVTILSLVISTNCASVYMPIPEFSKNVSEKEIRVHLTHGSTQRLCAARDIVCRSNDTVVCAVRMLKGEVFYKEFNNSCVLFISNMCEYPGEEFNIISSMSCAEYLKSRRHSIMTSRATIKPGNSTNVTSTAKPILREETTMSPIYEYDTAFDFHLCPLTCPDVYAPVCVCVNRNVGRYLKFFTFVNHCEADRYYCKHWEEFSPPPGEDEERIQSSQLGWSYCGSSRYLMFARFAEASSSLGHYGWLHGPQRYSHIMEPYERKPGYG